MARGGYLKKEALTEETMGKIRRLNDMAMRRGQSLAQMSLGWLLYHPTVTSVIIGASSVEQIANNLQVLNSPGFTDEELREIDSIVKG